MIECDKCNTHVLNKRSTIRGIFAFVSVCVGKISCPQIFFGRCRFPGFSTGTNLWMDVRTGRRYFQIFILLDAIKFCTPPNMRRKSFPNFGEKQHFDIPYSYYNKNLLRCHSSTINNHYYSITVLPLVVAAAVRTVLFLFAIAEFCVLV